MNVWMEELHLCPLLTHPVLFVFLLPSPHDVLATLLNNLKVQERQNRVCTTVAIAIVAETCSPFTVLPALMNEYRVPELNVQNGVLKSLSFLFEYIGEMGKDYIYAVTPLLEDALMDRWVEGLLSSLHSVDLCVHRTTCFIPTSSLYDISYSIIHLVFLQKH